ncbi:hypothetical protein [Limnofasciculus baicalensis]|uniref:Uncharacterized protein n=1 Tax=Limnofasciculus baicalensis BBK-W-15 TaxID=2699891 RepID=A0AAE3KMF7_9CYAN|nr:hypothetical protein [Limnofasciculus baicalensis]MCP2728776.1 hypothetical protein [Limnofasciculus baicalensis BBK-W-15]
MFGLFNKKSQDNGSAPKTKKSEGYFLELDETGNVKSEAPAPVAAKVAAPAAETPAAKVAEAPKAKTKTSVKKAATSEKAKVATPTVAVSNPRVEPQPGVTFAPNNLLPLTTNNSRRRPGPSMNSFLDMASQMKTPAK